MVGRRYGAESAVTASNAFFLKHEMLPANRGVSGIALASEVLLTGEFAVSQGCDLGRARAQVTEHHVGRTGKVMTNNYGKRGSFSAHHHLVGAYRAAVWWSQRRLPLAVWQKM